MTAVTGQAVTALPGSQFPLGATVCDGGTNFAVASAVADGMLLCLFDEGGTETQIRLRDYDAGVWHAFVPGIGPGQAYGYRATGPYDPVRGVRCNPAKLLLDPYARALSGSVTFGAEVLGYAVGDPDAPSTADSAACVPRSVVVAGDAYRWRDGAHPRHRFADTITRRCSMTTSWSSSTPGGNLWSSFSPSPGTTQRGASRWTPTTRPCRALPPPRRRPPVITSPSGPCPSWCSPTRAGSDDDGRGPHQADRTIRCPCRTGKTGRAASAPS